MSCYINNCKTITPSPFIPAYGCGRPTPPPKPGLRYRGDNIITERGDHLITERYDHMVLE